MSVHLRVFARRKRAAAGAWADLEGRVCSELSADLPDEDLGENLGDALDLYEMGSKPRCEEVEYLELVQEAIERIERGR
ncbi:hypothetical protein [Streptomyces jeddahensis]|uniref:Uncharacterized protein n=1 Tax=Streptomyces jeddahensis TaxID=1716141 RepID=A0A177HZS3_9ACTN|nr:hypothetical protein [Streptomyces jeddahensis]OAH16286.1 hypothetical protein STSP_03610 [Streptomyces jeddahensis]